jgi:hypothetical protein
MKLQGTYIQVPDALIQADLSLAEKMVYIALLHFAGDDGTCWPSVHSIAQFCHVDDRTVQRSIVGLQNKKWITDKHRSHVKSSFYQLSVPHIRHSATGDILPPMNNEPLNNKNQRVIQNGLSFLGKWLGKPGAQKKAAGKVTLNSGALAGKTVNIAYGGQVQQNKRPEPMVDISKIVKGDCPCERQNSLRMLLFRLSC